MTPLPDVGELWIRRKNQREVVEVEVKGFSQFRGGNEEKISCIRRNQVFRAPPLYSGLSNISTSESVSSERRVIKKEFWTEFMIKPARLGLSRADQFFF